MAEYTFISYAHQNTRFALKLARHLQQRRLTVQIDQWNTLAEAEWGKAIERMVRGCDVFLLILSPDAVNSWVVREQLLLALELKKNIVPVLYRPCQIPSLLQRVPYIDFSAHSYKTAFSQLLIRYYPDQQLEIGYWFKIKMVFGKLAQSWWNVLWPLLWPGWLGPVIVLMLLVVGAVIYWQPERAEFSPQPTFETLAVVQPTATLVVPPELIATRVRPLDKQHMIIIPAGEFLMGSGESDPAASDDEFPQHSVFIDAYWIDQTEVTNAQYLICVEAGVCEPQRPVINAFKADELPVVGVNWQQAAAYCQWAGGRLPTEAEWEKAARGTDARLYPWGNEFDGNRLNYCDASCVADWRDMSINDGHRYTAPAGSFPEGASPYGVLDMSGNVWEWTTDWYAADSYAGSVYENPTGPESGLQRVIRGGSWYYFGKNLRVTNRHKDTPASSHDNIGFRCVVDET